MDRTRISLIAHRLHPIAAPVFPDRLRALVARLSPPSGGRVVDLGCGAGEWLLELLAQRRDLTGVGVDLSVPERAATSAAQRGLADRVEWVQGDAAAWTGGPVDVVVCIGASHAFGGLEPTLEHARGLLRPGGQVLLGDGIWEAPPNQLAQEALGAGPDDLPSLAGLVAETAAHGFEAGYGHVSTLEEWDDYEWSWTASLAEWALRDAPTAADREQTLAEAREHRRQWLEGYRGQLGFVTLVLTDAVRAAPQP